jgi:O-succinylbenzoate synthase
MLRLQSVELMWLDLHLRQPHRAAHGTEAARPVVLVRVVTPEAEGWGECAALGSPTYRSEHAAGAWLVLRDHLVPRLVDDDRWRKAIEGQERAPGADPDRAGNGKTVHPARWRDLEAQAAARAVGQVLADVRGHQMAKAALEMAVLDAVLRASGRSLAEATGVEVAAVPAGAVVGLARVDEDGPVAAIDRLVAEAEAAVGAGFRRLRVKIQPGWDVEPLRALRAAFPGLLLQADANGAYQRGSAEELAALDPLGLGCLEQPLAADDLVGHSLLARRLATPLCLDETIQSPADVETVARLEAAAVACLKPPCLGGVDQALAAIAACQAAGMAAWCGGMLQTALGRAVDAAVAGQPGFELPGDFGPGGWQFDEDDPFGPVTVEGGAARLHDGPGVGPAPDLDALERVVRRRERCS